MRATANVGGKTRQPGEPGEPPEEVEAAGTWVEHHEPSARKRSARLPGLRRHTWRPTTSISRTTRPCRKTAPPNVEHEERTLCATDKDESVKVECERVENVRKRLWSTEQAKETGGSVRMGWRWVR